MGIRVRGQIDRDQRMRATRALFEVPTSTFPSATLIERQFAPTSVSHSTRPPASPEQSQIDAPGIRKFIGAESSVADFGSRRVSTANAFPSGVSMPTDVIEHPADTNTMPIPQSQPSTSWRWIGFGIWILSIATAA